jgi:hypothetical protein
LEPFAVTEFDDKEKNSGWNPDDISRLPFQVDPSDLNRDMSSFYTVGATAELIDRIAETPEQFSFEQLKALSDYLENEKLARHFPGASYTQIFYKTDPNPVGTIEQYPIHLNHRFVISHSNYNRNVLIDASLRSDSVEIPSGLTLHKEHRFYKIENRDLILWPLRLSPGNEVTLDKALLELSRIEFNFQHGPGSGFVREFESIRLGTTGSLGVVNFPHKILATMDSLADQKNLIDLKSLTGTWVDSVETLFDGDTIKLSLKRNVNFLGAHRSLSIKNEGTIPIIIRFSDPILTLR